MLRASLLKPFAHCPHLTAAKRMAKAPRANTAAPKLTSRWLPLYAAKQRQPFAPSAARGPWIVTTTGGIVFDCGGYGMLPYGHNPPNVMRALRAPQSQANIMTPNAAQDRFIEAIAPHIGSRSVACLNSGSEANSLAMRIANSHGRDKSVVVAVRGGFHGRTEGPAAASESSHEAYRKHLASFRTPPRVRIVEQNSLESVDAVFDDIARAGEFPECTVLEPVMGEGRPGAAVTAEFYTHLHNRTREAGGLVLVDSVQAGFRCTGALSITGYPSFEEAPLPDLETFAKAIHGGVFPASVLALNERAHAMYRPGTYGNTMSASPRALDVVSACLDEMTPDLSGNIVRRGRELKLALEAACSPQQVESVHGTGLLVALRLREHVDLLDTERALRLRGLNVVHAGSRSIRLTPWFHLDEQEVNLITQVTRSVLG